MNKLMLRKPLALLLAVVMLLSTTLVNVPVYAVGPASSIVEGDNIISDYLSVGNTAHVYLQGSSYSYGGVHDWVVDWRFWRRGRLIEIGHYEFHPGIVEDSTEGVEITSTSYLEPGTYNIVLVSAYVPTFDDLLQKDVDVAEIVGEYTLTVTANQAPTTGATFEFEIDEDSSLSENVLSSFTDPDGHPIKVTGISGIDGLSHDDNNLYFTPDPDWNGELNGTFTVSDESPFNEKEITVNVKITVKPVNDPPVIVEESYSTPINTPVTIVDPSLNDIDPESTSISLVGNVTVPANQGTMNGLEFTPFNGFLGDATLTYKITDTPTDGTSAIEVTGTINVNVFEPGQENFAPVANDDTETTNVGVPVVVYPLTNDTDADGDDLELSNVVILTDVDGDSVSHNPLDDFFTYTPNGEFVNTVLVSYTVSDGNGGSDTGQVSIHINVATVDDIVSAVADELIVTENGSGSVDVTLNDSFPDGFSHITLDIHDASLNATIIDNTKIKIDPNSNVTGDFTIHYTIYDTDDDFDSSVVEVTVNEDDNDLRLYHDRITVDEGSTTVFNVLDNDRIPRNEEIKSIVISDQASKGTATIALNGEVTYIADDTFDGNDNNRRHEDKFWYQVELFSGEIDTEYVLVYIDEVDYIKLENDHVRLDESSDWVKVDVLDNDIIPEEILKFQEDGSYAPAHGEIRFVKAWNGNKLDRNNSYLEYKPDNGFNGIDSFGYKVKDADGTWDEAVVDVQVDKIDRDDHLFEDILNMNTPINVEGSRDVSSLDYPDYFDESTIEVTDVSFELPADSGNGIPNETGTLAKYKPNTMASVTLVFTVEDDFGHVAKGKINVIVLSDTTTDYVYPQDLSPIRVNQYSDPESVRTDVVYHTSDGFAPEFKFEYPEHAPSMFPTGFYEFDKRDDNGKFISVTKYFGEFLLKYGMENDGDDIYAPTPPILGLRPVSVNGKPLIDMEQVDPKDIDYGFTPIELLTGPSIDNTWVYQSQDILDHLYGYDFEDYRHGGLDPVDTLKDQMPTLYTDETGPSPGAVKVDFRLVGTNETTVHDILDFWQYVVVGNIDEEGGYKENPMGSLESGSDFETDYTIYSIQFMMTDSEGFSSDWSEPWMLKVYNEAPEIIYSGDDAFDDFIVIQTGDSIEFGDMIEIEDDEDYNFAMAPYDYLNLPLANTQDDLFVEVRELYSNNLIWSRDGANVPDPDNAFDTSVPGIYKVTFVYTDIHGLSVEDELELWIVPESDVNVDSEGLEIEIGGYFPTFMGVTADFWSPMDMFPIGLQNEDLPPMPPVPPAPAENGDIIQYILAKKDGVTVGSVNVHPNMRPTMFMNMMEEFGQIHRFTSEGPKAMTYHAVQEIFDDGTWVKIESNPISVGDLAPEMINNYMRTVTVTDEDFGDYFLSSDLGDMNMMEYPGPMRHDFVGRRYPLVSKFKFVEGDEGQELVSRIVSVIVETAEPSPDSMENMVLASNELNYRFFPFLDIAESFDGEIYGLDMGQKIWRYAPNFGSFQEVINLTTYINQPGLIDEIRDLFDEEDADDIEIEFNPVLSLTADKDGNLVMMLTVRAELDDDFSDIYNVLVVMSPLGELISLDLTDTQDGYMLINDVAYDEELEVLYGIGTRVFMGNEPGSISADSLSEYYNQELFKLEKVVEEPDEDPLEESTEPTTVELMVYEGRYTASDIADLEDYHFSGIAVLNGEILLTKFDIDEMQPAGMPMMDTNSYLDVFDVDGNELSEGTMLPDGFTWSFGAAAKFDKEMTMTLSPNSIISGNTSTVTVNVSPKNSFSGTPVWSHNGAGSLEDAPGLTDMVFDENGNFSMVYLSVSGTAETVTIEVEFDGYTEEVVLNVSNPFVPTPDPDPTPAAAPAPAAPTVNVTLDTDAITLDYGETADPNFTSFDFTETVTGTTNTAVTWSLSDDTFVSVDANGLVSANANIPVDTGDITVTLTVTTVDGGATATATIIFEEQTPLGAIEFFEPYVSGYSDGTFKPDNIVTRAEVASMFARVLRLRTTTLGSQKFVDVSNEHWAYGSIQAMYTTGLFSGYLDADGNRFFDPSAPISRGEIAQVISNYWSFLNISVTDVNTRPIPDVSNNYWAASAINRIFNTGIFEGFDDGTFRPEEPTLRGQIVSMINRLIARPANEAGSGTFTDILPTDEFFGDIEAASQTFLNPQGN